MDLLFTAAIILAASFITALTGFGFFIVATPGLSLVMDAKSAVILAQLVCVVLGPIVVWPARRDVDRGLFATLLLSSLVGMPLGAYVLVVISEQLLRMLIGAMMVVATLALLTGYQARPGRERAGAVVAGFLSGVLGSATSIGGPPVILFLASQRMSKDGLRATIAAMLFATTPFSLTMLSIPGLVTGRLVVLAALMAPACLLGYLLAIRLLPRIRPRRFRQMTVLLVLATGLLIVASEVGKKGTPY